MSKRRAPEAAPETGSPRTLIELVYTRMRDDIVEGRLAPGEKLRIEHLRLRYGIGAGTLREAVTRLVSDALVETEGQRGFRVTPISLADLADLTELRLHIELDALRQSIRLGGAAWRTQLQRAFEALDGCAITPQNRKQWEALNTHFHEVLISGRPSAWTLRVWRVLARHGERYRRVAIALLPTQRRDVVGEHRQIYEAAMDGNEARAALALEAHIRASYDLLARDGSLPAQAAIGPTTPLRNALHQDGMAT